MSTLVNRNVMVDGRRTSMRLEPEMWEALYDICRYENLKISRLCSLVSQRRGGASLTSAMRVFIISYFKAAAMARNYGMNMITEPSSRILDQALSMRDGAVPAAANSAPSYN